MTDSLICNFIIIDVLFLFRDTTFISYDILLRLLYLFLLLLPFVLRNSELHIHLNLGHILLDHTLLPFLPFAHIQKLILRLLVGFFFSDGWCFLSIECFLAIDGAGIIEGDLLWDSIKWFPHHDELRIGVQRLVEIVLHSYYKRTKSFLGDVALSNHKTNQPKKFPYPPQYPLYDALSPTSYYSENAMLYLNVIGSYSSYSSNQNQKHVC